MHLKTVVSKAYWLSIIALVGWCMSMHITNQPSSFQRQKGIANSNPKRTTLADTHRNSLLVKGSNLILYALVKRPLLAEGKTDRKRVLEYWVRQVRNGMFRRQLDYL